MPALSFPPTNIFTETNVQKYVDEALATVQIPEGCHGAYFSWIDLKGNWKFTAVQRIGTRWDVGVTMSRDLARGIQGAVVCRGFW